MRPKVEAALSFGGETLITSIDALETALAGERRNPDPLIGFAAGNGRRRRQLKGRAFTRVADWSRDELLDVLDLADELKRLHGPARSTTCCPAARSG